MRARVRDLLILGASAAAGLALLVLARGAALALLLPASGLLVVAADRLRRRRAGYDRLGLLRQGRAWTGLHEGHPVTVRPAPGPEALVRVEVHLPRRRAVHAAASDAPCHAAFDDWATRRKGLHAVSLAPGRVAASLRGGWPEPDELARDLDALVALARAASHLTQERQKTGA